MIGPTLRELKASALADLPAQCAAVAAAEGITLPAPATVQTWWEAGLQLDRALYPVLAILWDSSRTGLKKLGAGVRDTVHQVEFKYVVLATRDADTEHFDLGAVEAPLTYFPEALLRWFDVFPASGTAAGDALGNRVRHLGGDQEQDIEISHDLELQTEDALLWSVTVRTPVKSRHTPAP